ncbi:MULTISPECIES: tannase/feruloyl esterase family alpha/beta hydrolase [unclassified Pseudomonas]|uniref:tannase/feruloyl esterase family alpha/beta hydrolase n=1 Tax=unclassified Pseudomonas TaxID=196821 RepID=UPI000BC92662|nr:MULTISPECIES: tannase/feruloyl esterase family alpha/beta hydrolase [unclassified Pseudomonas]PVZ19661.1 tannase/feruloyl esterase [Pseudomonas sp. URIL14HWK12:I12]PVZ22754.1 tannase/feruloyl esterase [Pseudomonas sp. URIL14HWK12:I10]PVZ37616.1 tannase/feruloyl esterase [Pseudomonas sp. URIL14HWK12:I11]SNZ15257.1 Tannase and feruloyl esterase [Pseudomonas sp. URIL14HWK12:I9]
MKHVALPALAAMAMAIACVSSSAKVAVTQPPELAWLADAQACAALTSLKLEQGQVAAADFVASASAATLRAVPTNFSIPFCRVRLTATPALGASINHEVWLPVGSAWNGRFLGTGNGGFAGRIVYSALANGLTRGYAVANTDVGTHADSGFIQMAGHSQRVENYHQRAVHQMTVLGKAVAAAFYQRAPRYALFAGCSSGGFEAMTEALNYPSDYDGIVAGAPGIDFAGVGLFQGFSYAKTQASPAAAIGPGKLPAIEAAVLKQCDAGDGLADGQIDDPSRCEVDLEPLLCQGSETDQCLTRPQLDALVALRNGPVNPRSGERYYPVFPAGAENAGGARARIAHLDTGTSIIDASPGPLALVLGQGWRAQRWSSFDFDTDAQAARAAYAPLAPSQPDLGPFMRAGGKLILFHGLRDANIFAQSSVDYYRKLQATMGSSSTDAFSRLYLVPGMDHCSGGTGPDEFGQVDWKAPAQGAPESDVIASLDAWVSAGQAPATLVAAAYEGDRLTRTRPLCPWPQVARYQGGDIDRAPSFTCQAAP